MIRPLATTALAVVAASVVQAAPGACTAQSGPQTAALVELYISQRCDSCPPADRWLSALRQAGLGTDRVVPLSLHVDYWDHIGWKDPFAKPHFAARQRELAGIARSRTIYTPQVVLGGEDFRGWSARSRFADAVAAVNAVPARVTISLALDASGATTLVRGVAASPIANGGAAASVQSRRTGEVLQALWLAGCGG
jgi:hypothetical protein